MGKVSARKGVLVLVVAFKFPFPIRTVPGEGQNEFCVLIFVFLYSLHRTQGVTNPSACSQCKTS